eukprot:CAMPEP_0172503270 /NCGR_PEP_ID=MMETSP1066-20121228/167783_1 /TAXON_ID=671091 /ORGANISM="Coscinodiscus wailesii, Strain CCMP2513" /LENGTH=165 /DNA_ID=CAMNT_0013278937 /DNA_START=182 /DNA_END=679 /DNA_ORIENTATION=+
MTVDMTKFIYAYAGTFIVLFVTCLRYALRGNKTKMPSQTTTDNQITTTNTTAISQTILEDQVLDENITINSTLPLPGPASTLLRKKRKSPFSKMAKRYPLGRGMTTQSLHSTPQNEDDSSSSSSNTNTSKKIRKSSTTNRKRSLSLTGTEFMEQLNNDSSAGDIH